MLDLRSLVPGANVLWLTFDSLRYDVAVRGLATGRTPNLARWLGPSGWLECETPGTFTLPAHLAFFHGFLPTPRAEPGAPRLMALAYEGSRSTSDRTLVFGPQTPHVVAGFAELGYLTVCVGGVGFFNRQNALGHVLPGFFAESVWEESMGVASRSSPSAQVGWAVRRLARVPREQRVLLFCNLSATHVPHAYYGPPGARESVATQMAALADIDAHLPPLVDALAARGPLVCLWMADHGEAYGEDGRWGHRIPHPTVTTVPFAAFEMGLRL